jgi:pimeloyl-ACP methyl ester carboxylesterase
VTHRAKSARGVRSGTPRGPGTVTVVIAHGAWVDGTGWREVIALLHVKGWNVIAVQIPLSSLADDADAVTRVINHQSAPVVLVGQGYGGTVITQAGGHSKVSSLVYVAAFAPDNGESTTDAQTDYPPLPCVARFEVDAGGFLYLAPDAVSEFLAHDLPTVDARILAAAQKPIRASALVDRVTSAAWRAKPSWYVVTDVDRMISPDLQRHIANKINANVVTLHAGHLPYLSRPKETADVILAAVDFVRGKFPTVGSVDAGKGGV